MGLSNHVGSFAGAADAGVRRYAGRPESETRSGSPGEERGATGGRRHSVPGAAQLGGAEGRGGDGGFLVRRLDLVKALHMRVPQKALSGLAHNPLVKYISADRPIGGSLDYVAAAVQASAVWTSGWTGDGIAVAVVDSGIVDHADFANYNCTGSRIVYRESFLEGDTSTTDTYGHGTHVAGIIAGNGACSPSSWVFKGMAPRAKLVVLRALDGAGCGSDSTVIAAIQRAVQLKTTYNIRVLNVSLGRGIWESYSLDPLAQAVSQAWNAGIVVVVAAGNGGRDNSRGTNGYATIASPANHPSVITVGAMRHNYSYSRANHGIASYSSKGPSVQDHVVKPDLVATGNRVASAKVSGSYLATSPTWASTNFMELSGTSMAAPVVAGTAALILQKSPNVSPDVVKARMMKTAWKGLPLNTTYTDPATGLTQTIQQDLFTLGAGYLDINAALASTDTIPAGKTAASPTVTYDSLTRTIRMVGGSSVIWGDSTTWSRSVVWGDSLLAGTSVLWGDSVVWGDSLAAGFSVVWGDSVIWGDCTPFANSVEKTGDQQSGLR